MGFFITVVICVLLVEESSGSRPTCDFSNDVVKDCDAVIEDMLVLDNNVLSNVRLDLTCVESETDGKGCLFIPPGGTVNVTNSEINCLLHYSQLAGIHFEGALHLDSTSFSDCDIGIFAGSFDSISLRNVTFATGTKQGLELHRGGMVSLSDSTFSGGSGKKPVVIVEPADNVEIENCLFESNIIQGEFDACTGGAVRMADVIDITIHNCEFNNNACHGQLYAYGGAIDIFNSDKVSIADTTFLNNTASIWETGYQCYGGSMEITGVSTLEITNATFINNKVIKINYEENAPIFRNDESSFNDRGNKISEDKIVSRMCGGALFSYDNNVTTIKDSSFLDNSAIGKNRDIVHLGIIYTSSVASSPRSLTIKHSIVSGNDDKDIYCNNVHIFMDQYSYDVIDDIYQEISCKVEVIPE